MNVLGRMTGIVTALLVATFPGLVSAQQAVPEPTDFEAFAAKPGVEIAFTHRVGTIESSDGGLLVDALILDDAANPPAQMRGVRLTLVSNAGQDHVYLEQAQLAAIKTDLEDIQGGIPELESGGDAPYRVQGTASCWMPARPVRILCPSYRVGPDWSGLGLGAYGGPGFAYPGHQPRELAALIELALTELESR